MIDRDVSVGGVREPDDVPVAAFLASGVAVAIPTLWSSV